ncbi:MAG: hypothetical protein ACKO68_05250, partial [Bacteroidota bacterium]
KSIPGIAKTIGRAMYTIRNASDDLKEEIKKAGVDVKKDVKIEAILREEEESINQPMDQLFSGIDNTVHYSNERVKTTIEKHSPKDRIEDANNQTSSEELENNPRPIPTEIPPPNEA